MPTFLGIDLRGGTAAVTHVVDNLKPSVTAVFETGDEQAAVL